MESSEMIIQAANLLIHHTEDVKSEQIMGVETLICDEKIYQLQVCLVPKRKKADADIYDVVEVGYSLNSVALIESMEKIKSDKGLGLYTDITYTVQYLYVNGNKYAIELRMTTTHPQLIQFEQLN